MITIIPLVHKVVVTDAGPIAHAEFNLKNGINILVGKNASGKTSIVNKMASVLAHEKGFTPEVDTTGMGTKHEMENLLLKIPKDNPHMCILVDDDLDKFALADKKQLLNKLKKTKAQFLITTRDEALAKFDANIIRTKDFKMKAAIVR